MAAFDFPSSPSVNQTYTANGVTWKWNGTMWMRVSGAGYLEKIEEGNTKVEVDDSGSGNVTVTTDGTERLRVTSGGLVGIGTDNPTETLTLNHANGASIGLEYSGTENGTINVNSAAMYVRAGTGKHLILGSNGTEKLRIDSDGRLSAGGASAATNAWSGGDDLVIGSATSGKRTGITLVSGDDSDGGIYWSDGTGANVYRGQLVYNHTGDRFSLYTAATERLRITSNGDVGIDCTPNDHNNFSRVLDVNGPSGAAVYMRTNESTSNVFIVGNYGSEAYLNNRANGNLRFYTNSSERLRIDNSGRLGLGVVPEAFHSNNKAVIRGDSGYTILGRGDNSLNISQNFYYDSSDAGKYIANGEASLYNQSDGSHSFYSAASGSANASASMVERLRIYNDGSVRIGDNSIAVAAIGSGPTLAINGAAPEITLRDSATNNPYAVMRTNDFGSLTLEADQGNNAANSTIHFRVDNAERMRINSSFLLYGDTASDLSGTHSSMFCGSNHAFQREGDAGTYLTINLGAADGTVSLEADARSGNYPDLRFITTNDEQLRVLAAGHIWKKGDGALWHGTTDINNFSNAGRSDYNKVSIRAGDPNDGTSPTNDNSAIKIYPAGNRGATAGTLSGGIAWQHLDPDNGSWDTAYGAGSQIWMGSAIHDTPGQERSRFNLWMNSGTTGNSNPGNLAIEAYPNGMVRHPKVPAFMVRNSTNANAFSANAIATWNVTIFNNGSGFASNKFTAPVDGLYFFSCMMLSNASTRLFHDFRVNGTQVTGTRSETHAVANSYTTATISMVYNLSASDYVEVYVANNNAYGGNYANFNGYLIG